MTELWRFALVRWTIFALIATTAQSAECKDTDNGAVGIRGVTCGSAWATANGMPCVRGEACHCSFAYDDEDFIAAQMCCACGGGNSQASQITTPQPTSQARDYSGYNRFDGTCRHDDGTFQTVTDLGGNRGLFVLSANGCVDHCNENAACVAWDRKNTRCWFFGGGVPYVGNNQGPYLFLHTCYVKAAGSCRNTNNGATDSDGHDCNTYSSPFSFCRGDWDDDDFRVSEMCCGCGGGDRVSGHQGTCAIDDATRRRSRESCNYYATEEQNGDIYCAFAVSSRRRDWGGEAAETCQSSCAAWIGCQAERFNQFSAGDASSNGCDSGKAVVESDCKSAAHAVIPDTIGRFHLVAGAWGHVPPGCSFQSGGDHAAHFNRYKDGRNDGKYTPVCKTEADLATSTTTAKATTTERPFLCVRTGGIVAGVAAAMACLVGFVVWKFSRRTNDEGQTLLSWHRCSFDKLQDWCAEDKNSSGDSDSSDAETGKAPTSSTNKAPRNKTKPLGFLSLRFHDKNLKQCATNLKMELERMGHEVFLCAAGVGDEFGPQIREALHDMDYMVSFVTTDPPYAEDSGCTYTTYFELNYAQEKKKKIMPVKIYKGGRWPDTLVESLTDVGNKKAACLVDYTFMPSVVVEYAEDWTSKVTFDSTPDPIATKIAEKIVTGTNKVAGHE